MLFPDEKLHEPGDFDENKKRNKHACTCRKQETGINRKGRNSRKWICNLNVIFLSNRFN